MPLPFPATISIPVAMAALAVCTGGCANMIRGNLYTHTIQPYSVDFKDTPIGGRKCILTSHRIREPATRAGLSAEWDTRTIRQAARDAGMTRIHYADISTFSVLWSAYRRRALILYGD
jgi:hypothetical protein